MPSTWLDSSPAAPGGPEARSLDPYFRWAAHTGWRGFKAQAGWHADTADGDHLQIIARATGPAQLDEALACPQLQVPAAYRRPVPGTTQRALHFTARVHRRHLDWLQANPLGLQWELALPLRDAERLALGTPVGYFGVERHPLDLRADNPLAEAVAAQPLDHPRGLRNVVAVIDFGCPFLHEQLADAQGTRVRALWDQGGGLPPPADPRQAAGWPWQAPASFDHGRELGPAALQAMARALRRPSAPGRPSLDEAAAYRGIDHLVAYDDPQRRVWTATHGGHVLDVAAGRRDPLTGEPDAASRAQVVFVQLPSMTAADSSGGSLSAHVLDGVRYVLGVCAADARIALNLSYGTFAGPHDGSSLVETALDELLQLRRHNFVITLAAGNARRSRCHAWRTAQPGRNALLRCWLAAADTTDTFVELWYDLPSKASELQLRVRPPGRVWSAWVRPGAHSLLRDDGAAGEVVAMLRNDRQPPNGRRSLALLAIAPTAQPNNVDCALADAGEWEIELKVTRGAAPVAIDAWIERDDPGQNPGAGRSYFIGQDADDDADTLSSLATGTHTVAVGGWRRHDGREVAYSSRGPRRGGGHPLPLVLAVCEDDATLPGVRAAATRSAEVFRMNGTSVAAPVLARRLFNAMAGRRIGRGQWAAEIARLARDPAASCVRLPAPDDA